MLAEYLVPGGRIQVSKNVLELQKRLFPAPVQTGSCLVKLGEGFLKEKIHPKSTAINADLCFSVSTLEFVLLR